MSAEIPPSPLQAPPAHTAVKGLAAIVGFLVLVEFASGILQGYYTPIYPQIAEQSPGALFDGTEIDEILTLRVLTMTEQEKAEARATDPQARAIIDRCEGLSPADMQQLHGVLRDPGSVSAAPADLRKAGRILEQRTQA